MTLQASETVAPSPARKTYARKCPECATAFAGSRDARFCTTACKDTFWNREGKRGKVLTPLFRAWRGGRGSNDVARYAFSEICSLADIWNAEDRAAGRMSAADFIRPKMTEGWRATDLPSLPKLQSRKAAA